MKKEVKENKKNLYKYLQEIPDFRRGQGQRHKLENVLLIVIMSILSGYMGIRAIGDFKDKHKNELIEIFGIEKKRLPDFSTVQRILTKIEFNEFEKVFRKWSIEYAGVDLGDWISTDGKAICGTVSNPNSEYQKYTNLVSAFSNKKKQILGVGLVGIDKKSEIPVVKQLIKELGLEGVVFTMDALHCQRDTTKIIIESKNDYVIGVKGNQKSLQTILKKNVKMR